MTGWAYICVIYGSAMAFLGMTFYAGRRSLQRRSRALAEQIDSARCIACDEPALTEVHPEAWRCGMCDYEQGPGWERRREAAHLEQLVSLGPDAARAHAHAALRDAHLELLAALSPLEHPVIVEGHGRHRTVQLNPDLIGSVGVITSAWKSLSEARLVDEETGQALSALAPMPPCDGLYDVRTAREAADTVRPIVEATAELVATAKGELGIRG